MEPNFYEEKFCSIPELAEHWNVPVSRIEKRLIAKKLFASIQIDSAPFLHINIPANPFIEVDNKPKHLGGYFEISNFDHVVWDENDSCDFYACGVVLTKHRGVPLVLRGEWERLGKPGSLHFFWRLTQKLQHIWLHDDYSPQSRLVIKKSDIFIKMDEIRAFEEEQRLRAKAEVEQEQKLCAELPATVCNVLQKPLVNQKNILKPYPTESIAGDQESLQVKNLICESRSKVKPPSTKDRVGLLRKVYLGSTADYREVKGEGTEQNIPFKDLLKFLFDRFKLPVGARPSYLEGILGVLNVNGDKEFCISWKTKGEPIWRKRKYIESQFARFKTEFKKLQNEISLQQSDPP